MSVSAVVLTKNNIDVIANCLNSLLWCNEIIVIDNGSEDGTVELVKRDGVLVEVLPKASFSELRNAGKEKAKSAWILYIDADERVTPKLKKEIVATIKSASFSAYAIPRNNIHYGKWMRYGGWAEDRIVRLFQKEKLTHWEGDIHEHAVVDGEIGTLKEAIVHLTHQNLVTGLEKSIRWTPIEAELFYKAGTPRMSTARFLKAMIREFFIRFFLKKGYKDGVEGGIESIVQAINRFFVYEQLWEMQRKPQLPETYKRIEKEIARLWEQENV